MPERRPIRWPLGLIVAGVILLGLAGVILGGAFQGLAKDFRGPGETRVEIPHAGDYRLWLYTRVYLDGTFRQFPEHLPDGTRVIAQAADSGEVIELDGTGVGRMNVTSGQQERVALGHFRFPEAGRYHIRVEGPDAPRAFALREIRFVEHLRQAAVALVPGLVLLVWGMIWLIVATVAAPPSRSRDA